MKAGLFLLLLLLLTACASENLYEGFRAREATRDPLAPPATGSLSPSYDSYQSERARLLDPPQR